MVLGLRKKLRFQLKKIVQEKWPEVYMLLQTSKAYGSAVGATSVNSQEAIADALEHIKLVQDASIQLGKSGDFSIQILMHSQVCLLNSDLLGKIPLDEFRNRISNNRERLDKLLINFPNLKSEDFDIWLYASSIRLLLIIRSIGAESHIGSWSFQQTHSIQGVIRACDELLAVAEKDLSFRNTIERTDPIMLLLRTQIDASNMLIYTPGYPGKLKIAEKSKQYFEKLKKLKLLRLTKFHRIILLLNEAVILFEYAKLADDELAAEKAYLIAREVQEKDNRPLMATYQTAADIRTRVFLLLKKLRPSEAEIRKESQKHFEDFFILGTMANRSRFVVLEELLNSAIDSNDNVEFNKWFREFKQLRSGLLAVPETPEDIVELSRLINSTSESCAFYFAKQGDGEQHLSTLELGRSMRWKLNAIKHHGIQRHWTEPNPPLNLNSQVTGRVNVMVSLSEFGLSWTLLNFPNSDELSIQCFTCKKVDLNKLFEQYFTEYGFYKSLGNFQSVVGHSDTLEIKIHAEQFNQSLSQMLEWLWTNITSKIVKSILGFGIKSGSNIHICRSGLLASLPIQSSGYRDEQGNWCCFNDNWIVTVADCLTHNNFDFRPKNAVAVNDDGDQGTLLGITDPMHQFGLQTNPINILGKSVDLVGSNATKEAVIKAISNAQLISVFSHGAFNLIEPEKSYFELAGGETISITDIKQMQNCKDAEFILAVCEAGAQDLANPYEAIGITPALLWSGSKCVVAASWSISTDYAKTTLEYLSKGIEQDQELATSVHNVERQVRDGEIMYPSNRHNPVIERDSDEYDIFSDFTQPIHWAAFACHAR